MDNISPAAERVAEVVMGAIRASGLSQRDIAARTGMHRVTLSRRLNRRSAFTVEELDLIAQTLGTTVSALTRAAEDAA